LQPLVSACLLVAVSRGTEVGRSPLSTIELDAASITAAHDPQQLVAVEQLPAGYATPQNDP
jgi:hypothetical protein